LPPNFSARELRDKSNKPHQPPAILVGVDFGEAHFDGALAELGLLAQTAGMTVASTMTCKRRAPDAALFVGSGKADEIKALAEALGAEEVLFDQALSPAQQRNLERHIGLPVNDRTLIILNIFAERAKSHEGKLQVELARLQYVSTRLVRRWSHLERQSGGIGLRGGPGEKQIELDRRMLDKAVRRTKERLDMVKRQRATQRRQRERRDTFSISLVGYTNAGKSSLFNALVKAKAYAADQLFATLDTSTRQLYLGDGVGTVSLSDTVGFIRDLPHGLVKAFAATLQEAADADLLLHVVDAANPGHLEQIAQVQNVLNEIGAAQVAQVLVFNKIDVLSGEQQPLLMQDHYEIDGENFSRLFVSAVQGAGVDLLRQHLRTHVLHARGVSELDADLTF
jgi:GTPase